MHAQDEKRGYGAYSLHDAADMLGMPIENLRMTIVAGAINTHISEGGNVVISKSELERFAEKWSYRLGVVT